MFFIPVQIWLDLSLAPYLIKSKLHASAGPVDGWRADIVCVCVAATSSGFNMNPSSHILACFNMNSYMWKAMNSVLVPYWLRR